MVFDLIHYVSAKSKSWSILAPLLIAQKVNNDEVQKYVDP